MLILILFSFHLSVGRFLALKQVDIFIWMVVENHVFLIYLPRIRVTVLLVLISMKRVLWIVSHLAWLKLVHLILPIISCYFSYLHIFLILSMIFMVHVPSVLNNFILLGLWQHLWSLFKRISTWCASHMADICCLLILTIHLAWCTWA